MRLKPKLFLMVFLVSSPAAGGPVQSLDQVPFADANPDGDILLLGDKKGLVFWSESDEDRGAAVRLQESAARASVWSGGIASRSADGTHKALACSNSQASFFDSRRSAAYPGGRWTAVPVTGNVLCAMTRTGHSAILSDSQLTLDQEFTLDLPAIPSRLMAMGEDFLLLEAKGLARWVSRKGSDGWELSPAFNHGLGFFDAATQMDANASSLIAADDFSTRLFARIGMGLAAGRRVAASACETGSVCGVSLADDGSWIISGYWGHVYGEGSEEWGQLSVPIFAARDRGGVAIAHSSREGRYVYLGRDDGDWGALAGVRMATLKPRMRPSLPSVVRAAQRGETWWREAMRVDEARRLAAAAGVEPALVRVAIIDSGIDSKHPWLQRQKERQSDGVDLLDSDDNGFLDDEWGYDFVRETSIAEDEFGHGTHVAGLLMASRPGDDFALAPNIRLTVYRALDRWGKSSSLDLARAMALAQSRAVDIIHCSWGGGADTQALREAFAPENRPLVVSSAGNDGLNSDNYPEVPKIYPRVLSIGATDKNGRLAGFSNFGARSVDFLSPGVDIVSTVRGDGFGAMSGTSMAAPLATGAYAWILGLLRSRNPGATAQDLENKSLDILCRTAEPLPGKARCGSIRLDRATAEALR